jgi:HK97 family phage portal protein
MKIPFVDSLVEKILTRSKTGAETPPINFGDDVWYSGTTGINRTTALTYSAVFRAVKLISTSIGKLPLAVYTRNEKGKELAPTHPAYKLLRYQPNDEMSAKIFKQTISAHALLCGDGYAYIIRDDNSTPTELIPLNPENTFPVRVNGVLFYTTTIKNQTLKLMAENILHIRGLGFDGLSSYSVLEFGANSIYIGINAQKYSKKFFDNSARPSIILEHPGKFTDEGAIKRLRSQWDKLYSGIDNAHKTAILEEGMKANTISVSARDAQLIETLKISLIDIANWFGIPPHKLGEASRSGYNSLENENQSFLDECLDDWLVTWEEECRAKLLTEREKEFDTALIEFKRGALVRADLSARANYYHTALAGASWVSVNEVRAMENLQKLDGYDEVILPENLFGADEQPPAPPPEQKKEQTKEPLPENNSANIELVKTAITQAKEKILRRMEKSFPLKIPSLDERKKEFEAKHKDVAEKELRTICLLYENLTKGKNVLEKIITEIITDGGKYVAEK